MAIRVRNRFHAGGRERSPAVLASVVAMLAWKLAMDSIRRMREAGFDIDLGRSYFDYVCEYLAFLAQLADRIAHRVLEPEQRTAFTRALAQRLAEVVEDNAGMLLRPAPAGSCRRHFVDLFNASGDDYADFHYAAEGPDFGFRRCFADRLRATVPEKDRLWLSDQVMEIEVPEVRSALEATLSGLFAPAVGDARPRRERLRGD